MYTIQVLLIDKTVSGKDIINYIKNKFITTCNKQKMWYNILKKDLLTTTKLSLYKLCKTNTIQYFSNLHSINTNQVKDVTQSSIILDNDDLENKQDLDKKSGTLIVQINYKNSEKEKQKKIKTLQNEYKLNEDYFCPNIKVFSKKLCNSFQIRLKHLHHSLLLRSYIKHIISSKNNENNRNKNNNKYIDNIINKITNLTFEECTLTNYGRIRIKISKLINGIILPQNIKLYRKQSYENYDIIMGK